MAAAHSALLDHTDEAHGSDRSEGRDVRPLRFAVYLRISRDPDGTSTATDRQLRDCRAFAKLRGWEIAGIYEDADVSAWKRNVRRPRYEAMLEDLEAGRLDGVLVWRLDRLVRRTVEFGRFWDIAERADARLAAATQPIDTGDPVGMLIVTILVAFAQMESETQSIRIKSLQDELARNGRSRKSGTRPYGLTDDWSEVVENEAAVIRDIADRLLAGEAPTSVTNDLIAREIPTVTGKRWTRAGLTALMRQARLFGWREHHGQLTAAGDWPAIIDEVTGRALRKLLPEAKRGDGTGSGRRAGKYLLSGLLRCGHCGARMHSQKRENGTRRYWCPPAANGGCNRLSLRADYTDAAIDQMVAEMLNRPGFLESILTRKETTRRGGTEVELLAELSRLEQLAAEQAEDRASGALSRKAYLEAQRRIDDRVEAINRELAVSKDAGPLEALGGGEGAGARFLGLPLDRRRAVIGTLCDHIVVLPKDSPLFLERLRATLAREADDEQAKADGMRKLAGLTDDVAEARRLRAEATEVAKLASRRRVQAQSGTGGGRWRVERIDPQWVM